MSVWGSGRGAPSGRAAVAPGPPSRIPTAVAGSVARGDGQRARAGDATAAKDFRRPGVRTDSAAAQQQQQQLRAEQVFLKASAAQQDAIRRLVRRDDEGSDDDEEGFVVIGRAAQGQADRRQTMLLSLMKDFLGDADSAGAGGDGRHASVSTPADAAIHVASSERRSTAVAASAAPAAVARDDEAGLLGRTNGYLEAALSAEGNVCLVCLETIKRAAPMWNCSVCYCMFHMQCIQRWIKEGSYQKSSPLSDELFPNRSAPWFCPKCRHEYPAESMPSRYFCYCRKVADPAADPWLMPHSCGQTCARPIGASCDHKCLLLCHPGPCPPCPKTVEVACHCGKQQPQRRRCGTKEWSCGKACSRVLECGLHRCERACHTGPCPPCTRTTMRRCQCGKEVTAKPCNERSWQCSQPCDMQLSCGKHVCQRACHAIGECGPCPRAGRRSCPCGQQTSSSDMPCDAEVPTCRNTCGKQLECGVHRCALKCHHGPCGQCLEMVRKRCGCGAAREKELPCFKPWSCDVKCQRMRACGRHACKRRCCSGGTACPPCEQSCGRALACRNHRCSAGCHAGPCYPCPLSVDVTCFCGSAWMSVPCGAERITKPPKCDKPCRILLECHHSIPQPPPGATLSPLWHRCHFGPCPPCKQTCGKPLQAGCSHLCPELCHSAVRVRVVDEQQDRVGPWQPRPEAVERTVAKPCPPCIVPMPVTCLGSHETCDVPCFRAVPGSCLRKCGRRLSCGNHTCALECHALVVDARGAAAASAGAGLTSISSADSAAEAGPTCQTCEEPCGRARPPGCSHDCPLPCHPGDCPPCKLMVRMRCHCSAYIKHVECSAWTAADGASRALLQACDGACSKEMPCGHVCGMTCHSGPCNSSCSKKAILRCPCKRRKETHRCAAVQAGQVEVTCDETCSEQLQKQREAQQEADRARLEEQQRREQADLEQYQRKMAGGRGRAGRHRRRDGEGDEEDEPSAWQRWLRIALAVLAVVAALAGAVMLTY